jgi:tetratricopeptide (TPR) repeat protein
MPAAQKAQLLHDRGGAHKVAGRLEAAEAAFRAALALDSGRADTSWALGTVLLARGRFAEGYELLKARHAVASFRRRRPDLPFAEWRGEAVAGNKILIWPEQGFGDQSQSARFGPHLQRQGADVPLLCSPALARLFERLGVRVVAASGAVSFPDPDTWVMSESVAGRLGVTPLNLPNTPYLRLPDRASGASLRIGLMTCGDPAHQNDANRSLQAADAARLADLPAEVVNLHPDHTSAADFLDTAEIIAGLDLVISVDTAVAHLAGAMGKPCWVMVPAYNTDWRWMRDRTDSPWYPSMRLFRQAASGDWTGVLAQIEDAVARLADQALRSASAS